MATNQNELDKALDKLEEAGKKFMDSSSSQVNELNAGLDELEKDLDKTDEELSIFADKISDEIDASIAEMEDEYAKDAAEE